MAELEIGEAPEHVRRQSARMLAAILFAQGILGLVAIALELSLGLVALTPLVLVSALLALVAFPGGYLEWTRDHRGEHLSALSFGLGAIVSALALVAGFWWFVPLIGIATLAVMLTLAWRIAVRSEANVEKQRAARERKTT